MPLWVIARKNARVRRCQSHLKRIQSAKEVFSLEQNASGAVKVTQGQLVGLDYLTPSMRCPDDFDYTESIIGTAPIRQSGLMRYILP